MASASQGRLFMQPGRPASLCPSPTVHAWTGHQTWLPSKTCHQAQSLAFQKAVCSRTHPHPPPQGPPGFPRTLREGWGWDAGGTKILEQNRTPGKGAHLQGFLEAWNPVSHLRPGPTGSAA